MNIELVRFCYSPMGTFGYMSIGGEITYVGERPWADNQPRISCIPEGEYVVTRHLSPKFGRCWILAGGTVGHYEGTRTHILFHAGNVPTVDSLGCLLPGLSLGCLDGKWAVLASRDALSRMKDNLPDEWTLTIRRGMP